MTFLSARLGRTGRRSAAGALRLVLSGLLLAAALFPLPQTALAQSAFGCATQGAVRDPGRNPGLVADCEVLLGLKDTLRGTAPLNWSADLPLTEWEGVSMKFMFSDGTTRVSGIGLSERGLNGSLPGALGKLEHLDGLSLPFNNLTGPIPHELGNLKKLEHLNLASNQLHGLIPNSIGNLTKLKSLSFFGNRLSSHIPASLGNLAQLEYMSLEANLLSGSIPGTFGQLTQLNELLLGYNRLNGPIPPELGNMPRLTYLELSRKSAFRQHPQRAIGNHH